MIKTIKTFFKNILNKVTSQLPVKDPNDWTKTRSSTVWRTEQYCRICNHPVGHSEKMSGICNNCGSFDPSLSSPHYSFRRIYNGSKWVWQYKFSNTKWEIREKEYI